LGEGRKPEEGRDKQKTCRLRGERQEIRRRPIQTSMLRRLGLQTCWGGQKETEPGKKTKQGRRNKKIVPNELSRKADPSKIVGTEIWVGELR